MAEAGVFQIIDSQLRVYRQQANREPWQKAHQEAMACLSLESFLRWGVRLYDEICAIETDYRTYVLDGRVSFDPVFEARVRRLFHRWQSNSRAIGIAISMFEGRGYKVEWAEAYRKRQSEALLRATGQFDPLAMFKGLRDLPPAGDAAPSPLPEGLVDRIREGRHCCPDKVVADDDTL